ncbi:MAG: fibronectin type III domain-containing protein [Bacteroidales bacterium]
MRSSRWTDNAGNEDGLPGPRRRPLAGPCSQVGSVAANVTSWTHLSLTPNTEYFYRVYAVNAGGQSTALSGSQRTNPLPPAAPTALGTGTISSTSVQLTWTDNASNEQGFVIGRSSVSGGPYTQVGTAAADAVTYTDAAGLSPNTTYYYQVYAYNAGGNSSAVTVQATTLPNAPAAPTNLVFSGVTSSAITLGWTDNAGNETGFQIHRAAALAGSYSQVDLVPANVTTWTSSGLTPSTEYFYRVYAVNAGGQSTALSGALADEPASPAAPPALEHGNHLVDLRCGLTWTDNASNEQGFVIGRSTVSGGPYAGRDGRSRCSDLHRCGGTEPQHDLIATRSAAYNTGGNSSAVTVQATTLPNTGGW